MKLANDRLASGKFAKQCFPPIVDFVLYGRRVNSKKCNSGICAVAELKYFQRGKRQKRPIKICILVLATEITVIH